MRRTLTLAVAAVLAMATISMAQTPRLGPGPAPGPAPQGPPQPGPQNPQGPPPEVVLKDVLGFSEAQLADLHALGDVRRAAIEGLQPQIGEAERALAEALKAHNPDACNVGGKLLAVNALHQQVGQAEEAFRTGFSNLLTADQKAKVEQIFSLQVSLQAAEQLHRLGL